RDGATDLLRQRLQLCVTEDPALRERAPRLDGDPVLGAVVAHLVVDEVRVGLDLVHSRDAQAGLGEAGQVRGVEIGYADRVDRQVRADTFHDLPYAGDVRVHGQRPMHEIQVDPATQRLAGAFGGLPGRGGLVEGVVELGGDPEIVARQAGCGDRAAHALLVAVHLRGVEVPVTDLQRIGDDPLGVLRGHLEGAEPELGYRAAVCGFVQGDLGRSRFHPPHRTPDR